MDEHPHVEKELNELTLNLNRANEKVNAQDALLRQKVMEIDKLNSTVEMLRLEISALKEKPGADHLARVRAEKEGLANEYHRNRRRSTAKPISIGTRLLNATGLSSSGRVDLKASRVSSDLESQCELRLSFLFPDYLNSRCVLP